MTLFSKLTGILFIWRRGAMGDVLWLEPVLADFSKKYRKVYFYSNFPELFQNYPFQNVEFKLSPRFLLRLCFKAEYFFRTKVCYINLNKSYERFPKIHLLDGYLKSLRITDLSSRYPSLYLSNNEKVQYKFLNNYVVLSLQSFSEKNYRKIYGIDWAEIVNIIKQKNYNVIIIGKNITETYGATYIQTNIRELISIIYNSVLFIGLDSGPSHIAASLRVPCIFFFGAVNPKLRHLAGEFNGIIMQSPCEYAGCYHETVIEIEPECRLVGDKGIPKCCIHKSDTLLQNIDLLLAQNSNLNMQS